MVDKNKAAVCCLLTTSAIMLSEKMKESVKCGVRSGIHSADEHRMIIPFQIPLLTHFTLSFLLLG